VRNVWISRSPGNTRSITWRSSILAALLALLVVSSPTSAQTQPAGSLEDHKSEVTPEVRRAIEQGLEYLLSQQAADGSFREAHGRNTGVVSFAVLSFMSTGTIANRGVRGQALARGIDFVLSQAQPGGLIANPDDTTKGTMYEHAMSALLLTQARGVYRRSGLLDVLKRAANLIVACQNEEGGWRYEPRPADADISVTVMQLVALRAAKNVGIRVPAETFKAGIRYVKRCATPTGGFLYQPGVGADAYARTAAGVCSLLTCGDYTSPEVLNGIRYLQQRKAADRRDKAHLLYGLYYAAQVMHLTPDRRQWRLWFPPIRDELLAGQQPDGHWDGEAGPIYGTAMSVLILSVPYCYLPVYQH